MGFVSGSITLWNSTIDPGHPWVMMQRQRVVVRRADVDEVDVEAVDLGEVLVEPVEHGLAGPPVVRVGPVLRDLPHVRERDPLRPVVDHLSVAPARAVQPVAEVGEIGVGDGDGERAD